MSYPCPNCKRTLNKVGEVHNCMRIKRSDAGTKRPHMRPRKRYHVREVVIYEVLAHHSTHAENLIADNPNRDKLVVEVKDREAYLP